MNCVSWQDSWGYTHRVCLRSQCPLVVWVGTCLQNDCHDRKCLWSEFCTIGPFIFPRLMYNQYLPLKWSSKRRKETFAFSEMLGSVTWWTALVSSLTLANSSSYRQTSRRRTSPSHPQCRPPSAPARLRCVAYSCTRPGTCRWKTRVVKMNSTVLKTIWKMFIRSRRHKANQGDVNKDDLRVSSTLEGILH